MRVAIHAPRRARAHRSPARLPTQPPRRNRLGEVLFCPSHHGARARAGATSGRPGWSLEAALGSGSIAAMPSLKGHWGILAWARPFSIDPAENRHRTAPRVSEVRVRAFNQVTATYSVRLAPPEAVHGSPHVARGRRGSHAWTHHGVRPRGWAPQRDGNHLATAQRRSDRDRNSGAATVYDRLRDRVHKAKAVPCRGIRRP